MNAIAKVNDKRLSVDQRVKSLRDLMHANAAKLTSAAAGLLSGERMIQVACSSIRKNPELLDCTPASLFSSISEAGTYGWVIDGIMGQASLVPFNNRSAGTKEATLIPGYKGLRDLIHRSGECRVTMESVHEGDTYEYRGRWQIPQHEYSRDPQRRFRPVTHAYVVGQFNGGQIVCFSWSAGECIAHRDRYSQGWRRASSKGEDKAKDSPWHPENAAFRVMCMKTVLLDAIHRGEFPLSIEAREVALRAGDGAWDRSSTISHDVALLPDSQTIDAGCGSADSLSADAYIERIAASSSSDEVRSLINDALELLGSGGLSDEDMHAIECAAEKRLAHVKQ